MTEITNRDFYLFLNSYGDWKKAADKYGLGSAQNDGVVNKGEFGKFVKTEWDQGGNGTQTWNGEASDLSADLINKFWALFDTDCISDAGFNQLDDDELNKMKLGMDAYNLVNTLTAGLPAPVGIDQKSWLTAVKDILSAKVDEYIKINDTINIEDLTGILNAELPNAQFMATKDLIKDAILMTYQKNITELNGFKIAEDDNLDKHIEIYLASITDSNTTAETLKTGIENIINAYLATANITKMGENTLTTTYTGFAQKNDDPLNELQKYKATNYLTNLITNGVKTESDYANKQSTYNAAAQSYIEKTLANANVGQYATIMATTWAGVKDEVLKEVKLQEKLELLFSDVNGEKFNLENELQKILDTNFPNKQNAVYYYNINRNNFKDEINKNIDEYLDKDGNLDVAKIATYVTDEIKKLLDSSPVSDPGATVDFNKMNYDQLKTYSNDYYNAVDLIDKKPNEAISNAINICNRLIYLNNGAYKDAIAKALGIENDSNINTNINNEFEKCKTPYDVKNLINNVWMECDMVKATLVDVSDCTVSSWNGLKNEYSLTAGGFMTEKLNASITNSSGTAIPAEIKYTAVATNGSSVSVDGLGILKITAGPNPGIDTITVAAFVDGIEVGKTKIKVKIGVDTKSILSNVQDDWGGKQSEHLEIFNYDEQRGKQITSANFASLYNKDAIIRLHIDMDHGQYWNKGAAEVVLKRLEQLGECIYSGLLSTGNLVENILKTAVDNVITNYKNSADGTTNKNDDGDTKRELTDNMVNHMNKNRESTGHRIWGTRDTTGSSSFVWGVRFKDLVDDIIAEYNRLILS